MTRVLVRRSPGEVGTADTVFQSGRNLNPGFDGFAEAFGSVSSLEKDLLLLAASVFAADRAIRRGERELLARRFHLTLPVSNADVLVPQVDTIEDVLRRLSNDAWRLTFTTHRAPESPEPPSLTTAGQVLLFSGGLDSLAAAVEFGKGSAPLQLVSHVTHNTATRTTQNKLARMLQKHRFNVRHDQFFVSSRDGDPGTTPHDAEPSQRTRSFLFMTLGALTARRRGYRDVLFLAENGQMAIHLPLTQGRVGAFSTHTAHPDVLVGMQAFLSAALAYPLVISNPYVHKTKAEVVAVIRNNLPRAIPVTVSCWKNARLPKGIEHCGECVPCYVRRIALESGGRDPTKYARDPWRTALADLPPADVGRRNLVDLAEFILRFERSSDDEIMHEWPELYSPNVEPEKTIGMYRRFAGEARRVLASYSGVENLLA
jgi:7-cyano-7-deazaguanine synthase in queuosine biosynthesis